MGPAGLRMIPLEESRLSLHGRGGHWDLPALSLLRLAKYGDFGTRARLDTHIGSADTTLRETPEILKPVGMNLTINVGYGMIDDLVCVITSKTVIGSKRVAIECGTSLDMLRYFSLNCPFLAVRNDGSAYLAPR